jgi:pyruvate dehydrogenase E2 component (dihydrolipoamide acetyltransferase)
VRPREAPPPPETAKGEVEIVELNRLQQTVARRMSESKATVPHFYLQMEIDMSEAVKMRAQLKQVVEEGRPAPTFNDMVVKACGLALRAFPRANGAYRDGKIELYSRVNIGIAVAGQDALVVPTVFDADSKSLGEIAVESRELAGKVRDGTVTPPELSGGTFTVSNLGMYGIDNFSAVINPPQAALLAVGAVAAKPVVDDVSGSIVSRQLMGVTLACDHRILYGADGAQFLARVRDLLQQPLSLSL